MLPMLSAAPGVINQRERYPFTINYIPSADMLSSTFERVISSSLYDGTRLEDLIAMTQHMGLSWLSSRARGRRPQSYQPPRELMVLINSAQNGVGSTTRLGHLRQEAIRVVMVSASKVLHLPCPFPTFWSTGILSCSPCGPNRSPWSLRIVFFGHVMRIWERVLMFAKARSRSSTYLTYSTLAPLSRKRKPSSNSFAPLKHHLVTW